jgi:hypothetical protein
MKAIIKQVTRIEIRSFLVIESSWWESENKVVFLQSGGQRKPTALAVNSRRYSTRSTFDST